MIKISIIEPESQRHETIEWFQMESPSGSFTVCHNHAPIISIVTPQSDIVIKPVNREREHIRVNGGIMTCAHNQVLIIID